MTVHPALACDNLFKQRPHRRSVVQGLDWWLQFGIALQGAGIVLYIIAERRYERLIDDYEANLKTIRNIAEAYLEKTEDRLPLNQHVLTYDPDDHPLPFTLGRQSYSFVKLASPNSRHAAGFWQIDTTEWPPDLRHWKPPIGFCGMKTLELMDHAKEAMTQRHQDGKGDPRKRPFVRAAKAGLLALSKGRIARWFLHATILVIAIGVFVTFIALYLSAIGG